MISNRHMCKLKVEFIVGISYIIDVEFSCECSNRPDGPCSTPARPTSFLGKIVDPIAGGMSMEDPSMV